MRTKIPPNAQVSAIFSNSSWTIACSEVVWKRSVMELGNV
jgi:hypothetical protein